MKEQKNYIPAYGANKELHWFPMKIAISRIQSIGKVLDEENTEHFIPSHEEVLPNKDGHRIMQVENFVDLVHWQLQKVEPHIGAVA